MVANVDNTKLWDGLFYLGCIDRFRWDNNEEDSIKYLQKYCDELTKLSYDTREEQKEFVLKVLDLLYDEYKNRRIEYSYISLLIYLYGQPIEIEAFKISIFYQDIFQSIDKNTQFSDDKINFITKIVDHILLTIQYKNELDHLRHENQEVINKYKNELDNMRKDSQNRIDEYNKKVEKVKSTTDELNNKYSKLTIDFITILGIFTGCVFAVFGGFEGIKSVLSIDNISHMLIVSGLVLSIIVVVLFAFIQFIGVLTDKRLYSCNCDRNNKHVCSYYERYRILDISLNISLFLLGIGLFISKYNLLTILIGLGIIIWIVGSLIYRCKQKESK